MWPIAIVEGNRVGFFFLRLGVIICGLPMRMHLVTTELLPPSIFYNFIFLVRRIVKVSVKIKGDKYFKMDYVVCFLLACQMTSSTTYRSCLSFTTEPTFLYLYH
jgi:hypothetical protein